MTHVNLEELNWSVAEGNTEDYSFQNRFRHFPENFNTAEYPERLNIFWKMSEFFEDGFPSENELQKLHNFENRLISAVEKDNSAVLSMVLTGNGQREFVFHTKDPQDFISQLTNMPQEGEPYPIKIHHNKDQNWEYYFNEIDNYS